MSAYCGRGPLHSCLDCSQWQPEVLNTDLQMCVMEIKIPNVDVSRRHLEVIGSLVLYVRFIYVLWFGS